MSVIFVDHSRFVLSLPMVDHSIIVYKMTETATSSAVCFC